MKSQPTLFDNSALNLGQEYLSKLDFEKAVGFFEEAKSSENNADEIIDDLMDCCIEWQDLLFDKESTNFNSTLLKSYLDYKFPKNTNVFQKTLLVYIAQNILKEKIIPSKELENFIDILIKNKEYDLAEKTLKSLIAEYPEHKQYLYSLAQVQYLNGYYDDANENYIRALLLCPDIAYFKRVKNKKLKEVMRLHGIYLAPAYSLLNNVRSKIDFTDIQDLSEHQKEGITAYHLVGKFMENRKDIGTRKEIGEFSIPLWEECRKLL